MKRLAGRGGALAAAALAAACSNAGSGPESPQTSGAADEAGILAESAPAAGIEEAVAAPHERTAFFGDLHVHTSWSLDAYSNGNRDDPAAAYRYGRGEALLHDDGSVRAQLPAPLDFMAVTDHDAWLGETQICDDPQEPAYDTSICRELRAGLSTAAFMEIHGPGTYELRRSADICGGPDGAEDRCAERARHLWPRVQEHADAFYEPGRFTTFPAYEFSARDIATQGNLHRNVIFEGKDIPPWGGSTIEFRHSAERLWEWLEEACTGDCRVLAIPHNSNQGMGVALAPRNTDGTPFTAATLTRRARTEPLIEIHQVKGNSECARGLLTSDEDCNFELTRQGGRGLPPCEPGESENCAHPSNYVRNALKTGLAFEAQHGINPFKFGFIASTDDHRSAGGSTDESDWPGAFFGTVGLNVRPVGDPEGNNPGGLAGVWAEENTRESIFAALRRRETFGTSGTRIRVRMFAGWHFPDNLHARRTLVEDAYRAGVPMGADLPPKPASATAPRLVVWATKDPNDANLQRIQIVKGWTGGGETHERVYDVVCSDGRTPDPATHRCAGNGASVDLATCSFSTDRGAAELSTTWTDPDFTPAERAFYYARVLQNPTCRWTTHLALTSGYGTSPSTAPVVRERAWTSPIWYTPPAP